MTVSRTDLVVGGELAQVGTQGVRDTIVTSAGGVSSAWFAGAVPQCPSQPSPSWIVQL
jgi:hypothetical protein